jgi:DNA repair protein RecN (Recombination protein N)
MIRRLYIRDMVGFEEIDLSFSPGLVVFTGPSGAGKSLTMQAMLANFGYGTSEARLCELEMDSVESMKRDDFVLDDIVTLKAIRKERARYYLDGQNIPNRRLKDIFSSHVKYLGVRDRGGLSGRELLAILDDYASTSDPSYGELLSRYRERFGRYSALLSELSRLREDEKRVDELIEFTRFEIEKISSLEPVEGEYEELISVKQKLSRIDKINELVERVSIIFDYEEDVGEILSILGKDSDYFSDAMNQLRSDMDEAGELAEELAEMDIERILDRLEKLDSLIKRYGSISEALKYMEEKREELEGYEGISGKRTEMESRLLSEERELEEMAMSISKKREEVSESLSEVMGGYLRKLGLPEARFVFGRVPLSIDGVDSVNIVMGGSGVETLSGGEFNRLRLALMSASIGSGESVEGVVFLDEIDANVSGDESIAIADMVTELSRRYQVFAISHQPHLSARANQHLLVRRDNGTSRCESLDEEGRIVEIARIIGGDTPDEEAMAFARKLRKREGR